MALIERQRLIAAISPPIHNLLATQLVDEFVSAERRYIQRDWEPTVLDGGQFCEIVGRIFYAADSGTVNLSKDLDSCEKYVENDQVPHAIQPRSTAKHVFRVLKTIYKFRSQRGSVHISPTYEPNHMDAKLVIEAMRWVMSETLRVFWTGDREAVARAIRELLQFDVPCVGVFDGVTLVQRTDLTPVEEVLVLLHYAGEEGLTRRDIGNMAQCAPSSVTRALQTLRSPNTREVVLLPSEKFRLTDLGCRRVREQLSAKLVLQ